jgi:CTP synthase (UTP-ammonia lyase)
LLTLASCPVDNRPDGKPRLSGKLKIIIIPDTLAYRIYRQMEIEEEFNCNYQLNPDYTSIMEAKGLKISGACEDGGTRIIELTNHPFYIGTGFLPQLSSGINKPHPLVAAFLKAAVKYKNI